ncbi:MAG: lipoate protein ligase C-terminal domain-containing protein, partial [Thermoplasmata archaeon]
SVGKGEQPNTLVLCYPSKPYVCVGYHQDISKEVDEEYCRVNNLPIVRRQTGGGTVYLDSNQLFYHIIMQSKGSIPPKLDALYEKYLAPAVETYRAFGLDAKFRPLNDIVINGKKCSGNGAASLEDCIVIIGNVIIDAEHEKMANVLKVPSEKFREKTAKSIAEWITSLRRELGYAPDRTKVISAYIQAFEKTIGKLEKGQMTEQERARLSEIVERLKSKAWIDGKIRKISKNAKATKISSRVSVIEYNYKSQKLLRITVRIKDDVIDEISISGDFFAFPIDSITTIEEELIGTKVESNILTEQLKKIFSKNKIRIEGTSEADIARAIVQAKESIS